ncbi:MAG: class I SAM-dependent methyltransferase [Candidatus Hodarchaeota archaeon]
MSATYKKLKKINTDFKISEKKRTFIKIQKAISTLFKYLGIDLKVNLTYEGSYIFGGDYLTYNYPEQITARDVNELLEFVTNESVVLDIGCGPGRIEWMLAPHVKKVYGVDISSKAIKFAKKGVKKFDIDNVSFMVNNGRDLKSFKNEFFDLVFSYATFQHMDKETTFIYLDEIFRVLKRNGIAYLQFQNLLDNMNEFALQSILEDRTFTRNRYHTDQEINAILSWIGFDVREIRNHISRQLRVVALKP